MHGEQESVGRRDRPDQSPFALLDTPELRDAAAEITRLLPQPDGLPAGELRELYSAAYASQVLFSEGLTRGEASSLLWGPGSYTQKRQRGLDGLTREMNEMLVPHGVQWMRETPTQGRRSIPPYEDVFRFVPQEPPGTEDEVMSETSELEPEMQALVDRFLSFLPPVESTTPSQQGLYSFAQNELRRGRFFTTDEALHLFTRTSIQPGSRFSDVRVKLNAWLRDFAVTVARVNKKIYGKAGAYRLSPLLASSRSFDERFAKELRDYISFQEAGESPEVRVRASEEPIVQEARSASTIQAMLDGDVFTFADKAFPLTDIQRKMLETLGSSRESRVLEARLLRLLNKFGYEDEAGITAIHELADYLLSVTGVDILRPNGMHGRLTAAWSLENCQLAIVAHDGQE